MQAARTQAGKPGRQAPPAAAPNESIRYTASIARPHPPHTPVDTTASHPLPKIAGSKPHPVGATPKSKIQPPPPKHTTTTAAQVSRSISEPVSCIESTVALIIPSVISLFLAPQCVAYCPANHDPGIIPSFVS